jgi:hypothetical protein
MGTQGYSSKPCEFFYVSRIPLPASASVYETLPPFAPQPPMLPFDVLGYLAAGFLAISPGFTTVVLRLDAKSSG